MQFMIVYYPGPEGLAINVPLRWQHGPTLGVKVVAAWVSNVAVGDGDEGLANGRTYIIIETDTIQGVTAFTSWMLPYTRRIEVRPVIDYLPAIKAYEERDEEQLPATPNLTKEQREHAIALYKRYMAAATPAEAVEIWRNTSGAGGGRDIIDALRIRSELDQI